jgi:protease IV
MSWEQDTIKQILLATIVENRRSRRWKIFFRLLVLSIIAGIVAYNSKLMQPQHSGVQVALVHFDGAITSETKNYEQLIDGVTAALQDTKTTAVIVEANSPGGSPVYSDIAYNELQQLKKDHPHQPIIFAIDEVCASGCYYVAAAADAIYANPASIVGSIGVIYSGFGATTALKKLGLESRLLIAGKNKAMGYPFTRMRKDQLLMQQQMLNEVHAQFIAAVKHGRGSKLVTANPDLFSGRYWLGVDALKLGLIDGYSNVHELARLRYHSDNIVDFTPNHDKFGALLKHLTVSMGTYLKHNITELAIFSPTL